MTTTTYVAALACAAAAIAVIALPAAAVEAPADDTPGTCDERTARWHLKEAGAIAKAGYSKGNWQHGPKGAQRRVIDEHRACLVRRKDRLILKADVGAHRKRWRLFHAYRTLATEPGFSGEGYWLTWLAIPRWVVAAETNGYQGAGRWRAANPSGACGPYQLLGWTSCDTSSPADKLRHHRVADGLPRGSWAVGY